MSHTAQVIIGDRGRLVLPASVRSELGLVPGTRMLLTVEEDDSLRLRPYQTVAQQNRGLFANRGPQWRADTGDRGSLVDELLQDRRDEGEREE